MIELQDFTAWKLYDGAPEGSGRSEKEWLISENGEIGLFKYPKVDERSGECTTEYVSEHLAHSIGDLLGIKTANIAVGIRHGRFGSMSYKINSDNQVLIEGNMFIQALYPDYDAEKMASESAGIRYCLEMIKPIIPETQIVRMLLFDFIIGNSDRHQSNWAFLAENTSSGSESFSIWPCPLYDNGSSLCSYVYDYQIDRLFGPDPGPFRALTDTKSKSLIRLDGHIKTLPTHRAVVRYVLGHFSCAREAARCYAAKLDDAAIDRLLAEYSTEILSIRKRDLISKYLKRKMEILKQELSEH